ncbi:MAG: prepilin-type N-terminal cleavage/methylation domain-containing protein [Gemmatimonadales bacterium]
MPKFRSVAGPRAGFTLVEMLIAIVMAAAVMGAGFALFRSQARFFGSNSQRYDMMQNARGTLEEAGRVIRTMGMGVPTTQPVLVYGDNNVLAFNTDYIERDTVSTRWAAYFNAETPAAETIAWDVGQAMVLPGTAYSYPPQSFTLGSGDPSPAETYIFYFAADASTSRSDDYILWQQVNAGTPVIVARNILAASTGKPFFEYLQHQVLVTGDTIITEPSGNLPLERRILVSGLSASDSAAYVRPDSIVAVRINARFTNGATGTDERFREIRTTYDLRNNGSAMPTVCGRPPLAPGSFTVTDTVPGSGTLWLTWSSSVDQDAGEQDVLQYILYRKVQGASSWANALTVVKRIQGQASYTEAIQGNTPGTGYSFGVSAQDCTPSESPITTLDVTPSTGP